VKNRDISRRDVLSCLGFTGAAFALRSRRDAIPVIGQDPGRGEAMEPFTGPGPNPHWNSVGPYIGEPQKSPLLLLTDRPVQLETPRQYFRSVFTPNDAFYVRWHLDGIPNAVDLTSWKLAIEGNVKKPLALGLSELMRNFKPVSLAATNQCSGNSRSRLQPRVPGGQWGNGAMGNAMWTGVPLRELLESAGVKDGSVQVQFQGLETGQGPSGLPSNVFLKSLDLTNPVLDQSLVA
jgi:DMSO/TMAO reductase YedYZ molybdopterin-dependent catalytic subunit